MSNTIKIEEIIEFMIKSLNVSKDIEKNDSKDIEKLISSCDELGMKEVKPFPHIRLNVTNQNKLLVYCFKTDIVQVCSIYFLFFKNKLYKVELSIPAKKILFFSNIKRLFELMHKILIEKKLERFKSSIPKRWEDDGSSDFFSDLERTFEPLYEKERKEEKKLDSISRGYFLKRSFNHFTIVANLWKSKNIKDTIQFSMTNQEIGRESRHCFLEDRLNQQDKLDSDYQNQLDSLPEKVALIYNRGMANVFLKETPKIHRIEYVCKSCKKNINHILSQKDDDKENIVFKDLNISSYVRKNIICKKCNNSHTITKNDIFKSNDIKRPSLPTPLDIKKDSIGSFRERNRNINSQPKAN